MKKFSLFVSLFLILAFISENVSAVSFPTVDPGINIGTNLSSGFEPSGVLWHDRLNSLFVVWDNGYVAQIDIDGNILKQSVYTGGDIEGIAMIDDQSKYIYLLIEYPQQIIEFDVSTFAKTEKSWTLQGMTGNSASGAEALAYNNDKDLFYVGSQYDGQIYIYDIDISTSGTVSKSSVIATGINTDLAGLSYVPETQKTYAVYDSSNIIQEYSNEDVLASQYDLPGNDQEGVAVVPDCTNGFATIIIAEDSGRVMKYGGYPIICQVQGPVDADQDGFATDVDCNDNDFSINPGALEIQNDQIDNDCSVLTPDWVQGYDSTTLIPYKTAEIREDYHVFDNKNEFSYIKIPAQTVSGWYSFELDARATTVDTLYGLGIYVRNAEGRFTKTRRIDDLNWKTYKFYYYIPSNTPTEIRFLSYVRGTDEAGVKREHHLKTVTVSRIEESIDPMNLPTITAINSMAGKKKVILTADFNMEASTNLLFNGQLMADTTLSTSKTWTIKNLTCGTTYNYEIRLFSDLYNIVFGNMVTQEGTVTTAACVI